ncbi:PLP-dependent aminotransferase family protein [Aquimarina sp. AU474]|uniref:MocR-like pyridoxine biosynthesis transcription factor PdxR n=1 Tax=Aquimarina sp. AU474 TaxID=2108529 RepID=UPI000D68E86A|nr:PLP-dependent aminotransferase family protein [Aquimarina sp. AU474]
MSSPVLFPYKSTIVLDRSINRHLYLQLCDQIIGLIKSGKLPPTTKLPGSRSLSISLQIHRKTVIAAYDELLSQGWIESFLGKGTFVTNDLPIIKPLHLKNIATSTTIPQERSNFKFNIHPYLDRKAIHVTKDTLLINDGIPDHRLAPTDEIAKIYRNITKKVHHQHLLTYSDIYGNKDLRKALVLYLNQTRGLKINIDNVLITRGSQMGIYLASQLLLQNQNNIIVGDTNYATANDTFINAGGTIRTVPVDINGINTYEIDKLCKKHPIRAVYVTSHHHHPTTVTLSAERRMRLLELAQEYNFAIIEDDYDYDFHYDNAPILPLASNDYIGNVIYIGGFTKIIAPALRIGYFIAPKNVVDEAAKFRRIIDRQGDTILEQTLAQMITQGDIQRHSNKVLKIYKIRRDLFCSLLQDKLNRYLTFEIPKGGMAVWVLLNKEYSWDTVFGEAKKLHLCMNNDWKRYGGAHARHNGIRIGFASLNEEEIHKMIAILVQIFNLLKHKHVVIEKQ